MHSVRTIDTARSTTTPVCSCSLPAKKAMYLVTGATGFIGSRLAGRLQAEGRNCRLLARRADRNPVVFAADLGNPDMLAAACKGVDTVFHCAGYAHAFNALEEQEAEQHWRINFEGTRNLVEAVGQAGGRRFIFLSSVKAMGEPGPICADEDYPGLPVTAYGQSKRAAEEAILAAGTRYGIQVVLLRPAMVYGAGGKGNLERMGRMVRQGWFPPLPETGNHRSLVHVDDVVSALCTVADDARATGRTYIITGPDAPSGRELYAAMRRVLGQTARGWSIPETVLRMAARGGDGLEKLCGRRLPLNSETIDRLLGSAWYSCGRIERELGWKPMISLATGLQEMFERR